MARSIYSTVWERRRYWRANAIIAVEWWRNGQPQRRAPRPRTQYLRERDFCYTHGIAIYPDLGCPVCGQLPGNDPAAHADRR